MHSFKPPTTHWLTVRRWLLVLWLAVSACGKAAEIPEISDVAKSILANAERPRLFVSASPGRGLRTVEDIRRAIHDGRVGALWTDLLAKVDVEKNQPPLTSIVRTPSGPVEQNRDFHLVATTANRIQDAALVALIRNDRHYAEAALRQIDALFDLAQWPDWRDLNNVRGGLNADLRHGQLAAAVAIAYDWLYALLRADERRRIVEGLDRCAIQHFAAGVKANERWSRLSTNWMTVVVGGFGITGMALGEDHPQSGWLIDYSLPRMDTYLGTALGPEGEFNESVQYAGSIGSVVRYFAALRYASRGGEDFLQRPALTQFFRWYMQMTAPPGRVAPFGDPGVDPRVVVVPAAGVAAAVQDPILQQFYLDYRHEMDPTVRERAIELLYYDASLEGVSSDGHLPLARVYHHQGKLISSRSDWDPISAKSVVFAKAGRESSHSHADWGQVCIDGFGERLVVDIGMGDTNARLVPLRSHLYHFQQWGHNVLVLGNNATGGVSWYERKRTGVTTWSSFDPKGGGAWTMDLTDVYDGAKSVTRTVAHHTPRIVVVRDEAVLTSAQDVSLRWHLRAPSEPDSVGNFMMKGGNASIAGRLARLDGAAETRSAKHAYVAPHNRFGDGPEFSQIHEPYVEMRTTQADRVTMISMFCVFGPDETPSPWQETPEGWTIATPEGEVMVSMADGVLEIKGTGSARSIQVPRTLPGDPTAAAQKKDTGRFLRMHGDFLQRAKAGKIDTLFIGDSITQRWSRAPEWWEKYCGGSSAANFGIDGDTTQGVIWRIENGELDGIDPRVVVVMIGTNNVGVHSGPQIAAGVRKIIRLIEEKLPSTQIVLFGIFPRGSRTLKTGVFDDGEVANSVIRAANGELAWLHGRKQVRYFDIGNRFRGPDGKVPPSIMPDGVHLSNEGYRIWGEALQALLTKKVE